MHKHEYATKSAFRFRLPEVPEARPTWLEVRQHWQPLWLMLAHEEARDHARLLEEIGDRWCVYCGEDATDADHLVPLPVTGRRLRRWVPTVPACSSCNGTLSDYHNPIVQARAAYIAERLHRRYKVRSGEDVDARLNEMWDRLDPQRRRELGDLAMRLYHLEWGGLLRAVRSRVMPPPNLNFDLHGRV